jgi:hypothetical protein
MDAYSDTYTGQQEWLWTANFEAFDAFPVEIGSTPTGEYRFVVDGLIREGPPNANTAYHLESDPFTVSPWDGIVVGDITLEDDGSASFADPSVKYPATYPSTHTPEFPYVNGEKKNDDLGHEFCTRCSFRPWASGNQVVEAVVSVLDADGQVVREVPASKGDDGRWHAETDLYRGERAFIAPGAVKDGNGETNGAGSTSTTSDREPPDSDGDTFADRSDNCPGMPNQDQADKDGDGVGDVCDDFDDSPVDTDLDGHVDAEDNCPAIANADQADADGDGSGDACDDSPNGDDEEEPDDLDGDGVDDATDNCPAIANADQTDADGDGDGNACDDTPNGPVADGDGDGVPDASDNCPGFSNSGQHDADSDGAGDMCDATPNGESPEGSGGSGGSGGGSNEQPASPEPTSKPAGEERGDAASSIAADSAKVRYLQDFTMAGSVSSEGACNVSSVDVLRRIYGQDSFTSVRTVPVALDGSWSVTLRSENSAAYSARPVGGTACDAATSTPLDVLVKAKVTASSVACDGASPRVQGRVFPDYAGSTVALQRRSQDGWRTVAFRKLDDRSRYVFSVKRCGALRVRWSQQDVRNLGASVRVSEAR